MTHAAHTLFTRQDPRRTRLGNGDARSGVATELGCITVRLIEETGLSKILPFNRDTTTFRPTSKSA